jgi:hypothetical protein
MKRFSIGKHAEGLQCAMVKRFTTIRRPLRHLKKQRADTVKRFTISAR